MAADLTKYSVDLVCDSPQWWRFNVYIMVVGYDRDGNQMTFDNITDRVLDLDYGGPARSAPPTYKLPRVLRVTSGECAYAEIYVYAVANTLPDSEVIKDTPSFEARLMVSAQGNNIIDREFDVNPWGGLTIVGLRVDAADV